MDWIFDLKIKVPEFLNKIKSEEGFFHYSLSGDIYSANEKWGLGNAVFAVKIYYTLNLLNSLPQEEKEEIISFIKGFQNRDGSIFDPLISRKSIITNIYSALKNRDFSNLLNQKTKRAETRQSFSALSMLYSKPEFPYLKVPNNIQEIGKYLKSLNWNKPYDAGSHFSHLLFFLYTNHQMFNVNKENFAELIEYSIGWVNKLQSRNDGCWYKGNIISNSQKINGAMKIITGLNVVKKPKFNYSEKLIDLCLSSKNFVNACDILDVIYVLHYSNLQTKGDYRFSDIEEFCKKWMNTAKNNYFPEISGFSFYKNRANQYYYGAKITRGLNEPDIHGTVLILWGICLVSKILGFEKELGFKEFIT